MTEEVSIRFARIRIEGDGTSIGTKIIDTTTGCELKGVTSYTIKHVAGGIATAVVEFEGVEVNLDCEAVIEE